MTDLELIFTMLGEASTTEIARENNAQGFEENLSAAQAGGDVAGVARKNLESKTGKKVTTKSNYFLFNRMGQESSLEAAMVVIGRVGAPFGIKGWGSRTIFYPTQ